MHALILIAVLQGYISIPPIHTFQPYPDVKCPKGYSIWWPAGKEFDNDRYAECIKPVAKPLAKKSSSSPQNSATAAAKRPSQGSGAIVPVGLVQPILRPKR
jgi:hypothetical protein